MSLVRPGSVRHPERTESNKEQDEELNVRPVQQQKEEDLNIPDGGYGWVVVVCQLLITATTWGVNGSFGVFLDHYLTTNAFPGTSKIANAFIGGLSISQITLIAPLVTFSTKILGVRPTLCIGIVFETASLIAASYASRTWHLIVTQGLLFGWGCSFLYIGTYGIIPQWFSTKNGVATGIADSGSGLGGLIFSLGARTMISRLGLPWTFRIMAIATGAVNSICMALIRHRNTEIQPRQHAFDYRLLKSAKFILISVWICCSGLGYTVVLFSLPNNAINIGATAQQAATVGAMANLGMAVGRPIVGYFSDRVGRINMSALASILSAVFTLCLWTSGTSYGVLIAFSILGGLVFGSFWPMTGPVLVDVFGTRMLPTTLSVSWTLVSIPTAFAEAIALTLRRDGKSAYLFVQVFAGSNAGEERKAIDAVKPSV
ncbi:unnamed protein product [Clonostachys solani]|uniref:Major facilitator superfamily (MFS) profile domain-containing protein n=1 Tax=Clonostachys solani TaxID=160281 RepID=A0A9N9ZDY7_9HYPO|nr:unnamed protein product [Clonostachys solani]